MPIFFLFGLLAYADFDQGKTFGRFHWVGQAVWRGSIAMLTLGFIVLGARSYAQDVAVIESEMVVTAKWVSENLPAEAVIAAHDIGALGYFDTHELIDLAGLVSPEVIPFIRNEARIAAFLDEKGADYLIAFPEFYPILMKDADLAFTTGSEFTRAFGQRNMAVVLWKSP
jgi:hypothetical protein